MTNRFEGPDGRRLLLDALKEQSIVAGNEMLAGEIADQGAFVTVTKGTAIIEQGGDDNDVYLILLGTFAIVVHGKQINTRKAGTHIGEMAAIQPTQRRSATTTALEDSLLLKLTEPQLAALGDKHPSIYRQFAKELARRLDQRNALVTAIHPKIQVFIMSSVEALPIAREIQAAFEHEPYNVIVWTDGVFRASNYPIESLEAQVDASDFAIAIAQPDDVTKTRGKRKNTPRDNVIFELGFFMGRLGRKRALLLEPRGDAVKLPSDLSGLTTIPYKPETDAKLLSAALGPACTRIRNIIQDLGAKD